jgi:ABC-type branched-subunit amino acid transport system permease subunit
VWYSLALARSPSASPPVATTSSFRLPYPSFVTLAVSWNIPAGYVGQVNLGHAAFFGVGALVTRTLTGAPILLAMGQAPPRPSSSRCP